MIENDPRFFFVHVMKTGGSTLRLHIDENFPEPGAIYPQIGLDVQEFAIPLIKHVLELPPERRACIRMYIGHFPYVVARMLDPALITLTVLREPVDRTISYLRHCKRYQPQHRDMEIEEIYEDAWVYLTLIRDHQTKIFAMTEGDRLDSYMDIIELDDERLRIAKANLEATDVVGLQDRYEDLLVELRDRFGWKIGEQKNMMVSDKRLHVSDALRRRISEDNAKDVEFYEFARELVARRVARATR